MTTMDREGSVVAAEIEVTEAPITILLVDDNEQWLDLLSSDLEREGPFSTITALDATEALLLLRETPTIDCVIADYRMPEIDGLQLLERVREDHPELPYILLTGMGSEDVASRAIRAGVSDYFRKDPKADEVAVLGRRIQQAVEQSRLRKELRESEDRYRTIMEQITEGIALLRDGHLEYCNDRLVELSGYSADDLEGASFVDLLVPAEQRDLMADAIANADAASTGDGFLEGTLERSTGQHLDIEFAVRSLSYRQAPATMLSIRDVTAKKARERNLERERAINRTVQRVLIESRTRAELEEEIAGLLARDGYDLVWVGETAGVSIRPTVKIGTTGYLDELTLSTDAEHSAEPSIWTARTGEPQFPGDLVDMFATHWRDQAIAHGFRTGAALPLVYDNVSYGILGLYHHDPHRITDQEQQLLTALAETFAFAIHHIELKKSLSSPDVAEVELLLTDPDYYLTAIAKDRAIAAADGDITVIGTHRYNDKEVLQYLELSGIEAETFEAVASDHSAVTDIQRISDGDYPRIQLTIIEEPPELTLTNYGAVVDYTSISANRATLRFALQSRSELQQLVETLEASHGSVTVRSCVSVKREDSAIDIQPMIQHAKLTEKQAAALQAAYHHGYFEQPRKQSAKDIAEALGIVHSTYLQHLRAAQRKLFGELYDHNDSGMGFK